MEEGVGRKESIRAQLWAEVGKEVLEHLWPKERWTGGTKWSSLRLGGGEGKAGLAQDQF